MRRRGTFTCVPATKEGLSAIIFFTEIQMQAIYVQQNIKARFQNHFSREKTIRITSSESVSTSLFFQHAKRLRPIVMLSVACLALPYPPPHIIS
jgi:hypothetical protein